MLGPLQETGRRQRQKDLSYLYFVVVEPGQVISLSYDALLISIISIIAAMDV